MSDKRRMDAYYYSFYETGCDLVDKILGAVACAGKAYHHTDQWNEKGFLRDDHSGEAPVDWIQNAAQEAADRIEELDAKLAKAVEALDEAVYLLAPDEEDMAKKAGVYRVVTTLAELKG